MVGLPQSPRCGGSSPGIEKRCYLTSIGSRTPPGATMTFREAELGKLAHNAYIATKVSFTNEIEQICNEQGADPEEVMSVVSADRRVGSREHLRPGLGPYEGSLRAQGHTGTPVGGFESGAPGCGRGGEPPSDGPALAVQPRGASPD